MKRLLFLTLSLFLFAGFAVAQQSTGTNNAKPETAEKPKRVIFRPTKSQITDVQIKLKSARLYTGEATGTLTPETRKAIKIFQEHSGLAKTGTLNRATLEKFGIELTDAQRAIPVSENSFAKAETKNATAASSPDKPKRAPIFRATKDQINAAQRKLKEKRMYEGGETGKLDPETRSGLRKFQEASGLKVTGTLNQITLETMGIELTEKQKANAAEQSAN